MTSEFKELAGQVTANIIFCTKEVLTSDEAAKYMGISKTPVIGVKERNTGKVHAVVANYNEEGKQLSGKQLFSVLKKGVQEKHNSYDRPIFGI